MSYQLTKSHAFPTKPWVHRGMATARLMNRSAARSGRDYVPLVWRHSP